MKLAFDIDFEEAQRPLTVRERLAIHLLLIVFRMVVPVKFDHQISAVLEPLMSLLHTGKVGEK